MGFIGSLSHVCTRVHQMTAIDVVVLAVMECETTRRRTMSDVMRCLHEAVDRRPACLTLEDPRVLADLEALVERPDLVRSIMRNVVMSGVQNDFDTQGWLAG